MKQIQNVSSPKSPKTAFSKLSLNRQKPLKILVLGQTGVGKSALVVRYLTRRYIGEYDPSLERVYSHTALVDGENVPLEILDSAGNSHETDSIRLEDNVRWADVFVLMYSVADKCSFDDCNRLKFLINYNKRKRRISSPTSRDMLLEVPVVFVGNKKDLMGDRMVTTEEGFKRSRDIGCASFHEISVRENIDEASQIFVDAVKCWRDTYKTSKIRRASSELPGTEYPSADLTRISISNLPDLSTDGVLADITSRLKLRKEGSQEDPRPLSFAENEPEKRPFRGRASTDGWLHRHKLKKLKMNLSLRGSLLHERRMSIAMRGESTGF